MSLGDAVEFLGHDGQSGCHHRAAEATEIFDLLLPQTLTNARLVDRVGLWEGLRCRDHSPANTLLPGSRQTGGEPLHGSVIRVGVGRQESQGEIGMVSFDVDFVIRAIDVSGDRVDG